MPVNKWCLPDIGKSRLNMLHQELVRAVKNVPVLGVTSKKDITCLFPADMMQYGLGTEIIVEVTSLYEKPEWTKEVVIYAGLLNRAHQEGLRCDISF